jgi:monoamine oxidase
MASDQLEKEVKTVVVVGAGAAGLQAANILLESEAFADGRLEVIVLEARDRAGGRILVGRNWGIPFDCGILKSNASPNVRSELDSWNVVQSIDSYRQGLQFTTHFP